MADRYRVVRVQSNGSESVIQDFAIPIVTALLATEQAQRAAALARARLAKSQNPTWRVRVYSPRENVGDQLVADLIWDSAVNT